MISEIESGFRFEAGTDTLEASLWLLQGNQSSPPQSNAAVAT